MANVNAMASALYYLGIALLFTHEMDAVMHAEWRLLYVLRDMDEASAYPVFLLLHVPVFFLFFWFSHHSNIRVKKIFRSVAAGFLVLHALIHTINIGVPEHQFEGVISYALIYLAALCGAAYLYTAVRERSQAR